MFDLFDKDDFCIIFDYKCDIEIHLEHSLEFYQIKTHKVQSPYKFTDLKKKKAGSQSIIAKLFVLKDAATEDFPIRCALVSNSFFQIDKTVKADVETFCFSELGESHQDAIKKALETELVRENISLDNLYYVYTPMDLLDPQNSVKGKITGVFEKIKGCEPQKPNALYRLIYDTVTEKACYELSVYDYAELVRKKGITKKDLDTILERHKENTDNSVALAREFIDQKQAPVQERRQLKLSLAKILKEESTSVLLQKLQRELWMYMDSISVDMSIEEMATTLLIKFDAAFSIEYSKTDRYVFIILCIKRWECGINGQTNL